MVGVPRLVADQLADLWHQRREREPGTYNDVRTWVNQLSDADWRSAIPQNTSLTPGDMRIVWEEFAR